MFIRRQNTDLDNLSVQTPIFSEKFQFLVFSIQVQSDTKFKIEYNTIAGEEKNSASYTIDIDTHIELLLKQQNCIKINVSFFLSIFSVWDENASIGNRWALSKQMLKFMMNSMAVNAHEPIRWIHSNGQYHMVRWKVVCRLSTQFNSVFNSRASTQAIQTYFLFDKIVIVEQLRQRQHQQQQQQAELITTYKILRHRWHKHQYHIEHSTGWLHKFYVSRPKFKFNEQCDIDGTKKIF